MTPPAPRAALWLLAGLAGAAYVALLVACAGGLADHDVFVMARVARDVLDGKGLYAEAWDNKAPLAILYYAVPGALAPGSYPAIQAWLGLTLLAQAAWLFRALRGEGAARAIAPALLLLLPLQRAEWCWASSEHAGNLFTVVVLAAGWRLWRGAPVRGRELALAGAAAALAFDTRQNLVLYALVPAAALWVRYRASPRELARGAGALAAGFVVAFAAVLAAVAATGPGALAGYVRTVLLAPAAYGRGASEVAWLVTLLRQDLAVFVALAAALVALTGPRRGLAAALVATAAGVMVLPGRGYPHYWVQVFPAVALLVPLALEAAGVAARRPRLQGALVAGLLLGNGVLTAADLASSGERARLDAVAARVRAAAGEGGTALALGHQSAYLLFASGARAVHPVFWQDWLYRSLAPVVPWAEADVRAAYLASPPDVVAVDEPTVHRVVRPPQPDEEPDLPLAREVLRAGAYVEAERVEGWRLLRRGR